MASRRTMVGALGTLGLHVGVILGIGGAPLPEPVPPAPDDELVAFTVVSTGPLSPRPREQGPEREATPAPAPSPARDPDPTPPPAPRSTPRERSAPTTPETQPETQPETPPETQVEPEPGPPMPDAAAVPPGAADGTAPGATQEPVPSGTGRGDASGTGGVDARGGGTFDASSYGKEIVRIVLAELDEDPVPGLRQRDGIQVVLHVKPDGRLAWKGPGRYGFAQVLATSVGPVRTNAILKRIERASRRFPAHPAGLKRRHYVVDVTVKFTRSLARG